MFSIKFLVDKEKAKKDSLNACGYTCPTLDGRNQCPMNSLHISTWEIAIENQRTMFLNFFDFVVQLTLFQSVKCELFYSDMFRHQNGWERVSDVEVWTSSWTQRYTQVHFDRSIHKCRTQNCLSPLFHCILSFKTKRTPNWMTLSVIKQPWKLSLPMSIRWIPSSVQLSNPNICLHKSTNSTHSFHSFHTLLPTISPWYIW